ncbi:MAG: BON domain-containing protein [Rubrivivax sp.]
MNRIHNARPARVAVAAPRWQRPLLATLAAASAALALSACAPLLIGGAMVGGSLMAIDRRTSGAQIEDQGIELKAAARARELATLGNINVTSFNRLLLVTGQVPTEPDRVKVGEALAKVDNVREVVNELAVTTNSLLGDASRDGLISTKVKATLLDAKDLQAHAIKVVTERNVVYLMGLVTEREANRAAEVARSVAGVEKVVRVFELISEADLAKTAAAPTK